MLASRGEIPPPCGVPTSLRVHSPSTSPPPRPLGGIRDVRFEWLPVVAPRLPVYSRCRVPLETEVSLAQALDAVDMIEERRKPSRPVRLRCLPAAVPRTGQVAPALRPVR